MSDELQNSRTIRDITLRLIPLLFLAYLIAYLDRINIGFAAIPLKKELGISNSVFGIAAGLFFVGYFLFEVPSNLLLQKFGARNWLARIMASWGLLSILTIFVRGEHSFYFIRFLLGLAEAGFFPGVIFYIVCWYPTAYRARLMAAFSAAIPLSSAIGAPLSSALLTMDGFLGLPGWRWMFILEGAPAICMAILFLRLLPNSPAQAKFLSPSQKEWLQEEFSRDPAPPAKADIQTTLKSFYDLRVIALCAVYFANLTANLGLAFFLPQIIASMGTTQMETGWLTAVPAVIGTAGLFVLGWLSDKLNARRGVLLSAIGITLVGLFSAAYFGSGGASLIGIVAVSFAAIGIHGLKAPFWSLVPMVLAGPATAGGIAWINSIGNLGGFAGPAILGWFSDKFGAYQAGMYALASFQLIAALLAVMLLRPKPSTVLQGEDFSVTQTLPP